MVFTFDEFINAILTYVNIFFFDNHINLATLNLRWKKSESKLCSSTRYRINYSGYIIAQKTKSGSFTF